MAWNRHAIAQTQLNGVGRPKFDFHTGPDLDGQSSGSNFDTVALYGSRGVEADDVGVGASTQRRQARRRPALRVDAETREVNCFDGF